MNVVYPFPPDPPHIAHDQNITGRYLRRFDIHRPFVGHRLQLRFEGVDSSFHVWVNGKEIGYSQGARNPSEFGITDVVKFEAENVLAVRVYQFSDGSYMRIKTSGGSARFFEMCFFSHSRKATFRMFTFKLCLTRNTKMQRYQSHLN